MENYITGAEIVVAGLLIHILPGIALMRDDDLYNESNGVYWRLASMTTFQ